MGKVSLICGCCRFQSPCPFWEMMLQAWGKRKVVPNCGPCEGGGGGGESGG